MPTFKGIAACESRFGGHGSGHRPWRISHIYLAHQRFMGKQSCGVCSKDLLLGFCVPSRKPVPGPMKFAVNQRRSMCSPKTLPSFKSKFQISTDSIQFFSLFSKKHCATKGHPVRFRLGDQKSTMFALTTGEMQSDFCCLGNWRSQDPSLAPNEIFWGFVWVFSECCSLIRPTGFLDQSYIQWRGPAGLQFSFVRMPHALIRVLAFWI